VRWRWGCGRSPFCATGEPPAAGARGERNAADPRAGFDVVVVEPDPAYRDRARERAGDVHAEPPTEPFDAVVATDGTEVTGIVTRRLVLVGQDGSVWSSA
jgi:hypothetical protein